MKSFYRNLSIKNKLRVIIASTSLGILSIAMGYNIASSIINIRTNLVQNFELNARLLAEQCIPILDFEDSLGAQAVLAKVRTVPDIKGVWLFQANGQLLAAYLKDYQEIEVHKLPDGVEYEFKADYLWTRAKVLYQNKALGEVYLAVTTVPMKAEIKRVILFSLLFMMSLMVFVVFVANKMQKSISQPILSLSDATSFVRENHDFSTRIARIYNDETGVLTDNFNRMLEELDKKETVGIKAKQALMESEERFRQLAENIDDVFWLVDASNPENYKVIYVNESFEKVWQLKKEDIFNDSLLWYKSIVEEDKDRVGKIFQQFLMGNGKFDNEFRIVRPDGSVRHIWARGKHIINKSGKVTRVTGIAQDITERKMAEEELSLSEERFRELAENIDDVFWIIDTANPDQYKVLYVNPAFEKIWQIPKELILEDASVWFDHIHEEDKPRVTKRFGDFLLGSDQYNMEYRIVRADGSVRYMWVRGNHIRNHKGEIIKVAGIAQDVTHRKEAEEALRLEEERFNELADNTEDIFWIGDASDLKNYRVLYVNPAFEKLWGIKREEILKDGSLWFECIVDEDKPKVEKAFKNFLSGKGDYNMEFSINTPDKGIRNIWVRGNRILNDNGGVVRVTGISQDITHRKKAEELLKDNEQRALSLNEELERKVKARTAKIEKQKDEVLKAKEKAEAASKAKSEFLSVMSHEIRTPMNGVIGMTYLLLDEDPKPNQVENLNTLKYSAEHLLSLINDILDFNKLEAGKVTFEHSDFSFSELIKEVYYVFKPRAASKGLQFKLIVDQDIPKYLVGDATRLSQVLNNLIGNAIKFTKKGNVTLSIQGATVEEEGKVELKFVVEDTGIGIPDNKVESVFDTFTQAKGDTTRKYGGSGLGLSIVKTILNLQGSEIHVESKEGLGSKFFFSLRFGKATATTKQGLRQKSSRSLKGVHVLIVEDNLLNYKVVSNFLKKWSASCDWAEEGYSALKMMKSNHYDLVLMDLRMPGMNGFQTAKAVRALEGSMYKELPIIALTADVINVIEEVYDAGMNDYMAKPFDPKQLFDKIHKYTQGDFKIHTY